MISNIRLSTTNSFDGYQITQYLDIVYESIVVGTNLFSDFFASVSDIFGGKSRSYQKQLYQLRKYALEGLIEKAREKGANAILGIKIDSDEISGSGKSMFMINVTGTAVVIKKIDDTRPEMQRLMIDGEDVKKHIKMQEIEKRYTKQNFQLEEDEIDMLIHGEFPDAAKFFLKSLFTIQEGSSTFNREDYNENLSSLLMYLGQFEPKEQASFLYPYIPDYLRLEEAIMTILNSLGLVDFSKIADWFYSDAVDLQHFALNVLKIIKAGYSTEDIVACQNLIHLLEKKFSMDTLEDDGKNWECACGKINSTKHSNCRRCNKNRLGFFDNEVQPSEVINILRNELSIVKVLLNDD